MPLRRHRAFIQPQSHPTRRFMNLTPFAIIAGFVLLAACATPAPEPQGDAPPEPVPAGITPLTQEQDELFG
ncbi:hypothetical protein [Allomesorhizobium alhagi]|uniref:hypothetical protein n=1 Tax=Allomesorhizobium alhagi TaxID=475067 RepID=UPI0011119E8D|nr:hypothetical protein [Mesorhizobium alhagi]